MTKIARCCCGSLRVEVTGEPWIVAICHCTECQRRTGSAFGASAHFPKEQMRIEGPSKVYVRASDSGRKVEFHFCPHLRHLGVLVCGGPPGPYRHCFWHVRRPVDALADGIDLAGDAASVGDLRSPDRSVYRPIIDTGNTCSRLMGTPTISDDV